MPDPVQEREDGLRRVAAALDVALRAETQATRTRLLAMLREGLVADHDTPGETTPREPAAPTAAAPDPAAPPPDPKTAAQELAALTAAAGYTPPNREHVATARASAAETPIRVRHIETGMALPPVLLVSGETEFITRGRFIMRKLPRYLLRAAIGNLVIGVSLLALAWSLFGAAHPSDDTIRKTGFESVGEHIHQGINGIAWVCLIVGAGWTLMGVWNLTRRFAAKSTVPDPLLDSGDPAASADAAAPAPLPGAHAVGTSRMVSARARLAVNHFWQLFRKEEFHDPAFERVAVIAAWSSPPRLRLQLFRRVRMRDIDLLHPGAKPRIGIVDRILMATGFAMALAFFLFKLALLSAATLLTFGFAILIPLVAAGGMARRAWREFRNAARHHAASLFERVQSCKIDEGEGALLLILEDAHARELNSLVSLYTAALGAPGARHPKTDDALFARAVSLGFVSLGPSGECYAAAPDLAVHVLLEHLSKHTAGPPATTA
jgi:hypothetical protein